jgi:hypothetical protein
MTELVCVEEIVKVCTRAGYAPVLSRMKNHCMEKKTGAWKGTLVRTGMALITMTPLRVMMLTVKFRKPNNRFINQRDASHHWKSPLLVDSSTFRYVVSEGVD